MLADALIEAQFVKVEAMLRECVPGPMIPIAIIVYEGCPIGIEFWDHQCLLITPLTQWNWRPVPVISEFTSQTLEQFLLKGKL